jgi:putative transcriptional regulator
MTPRHHLDPATVVSHAAGALSPEMSAIVATHLESCALCRSTVAQADSIGGVLIRQQQPPPSTRHAQLRASILERLDEVRPHAMADARAAEPRDPDRLPAALRPYFGPSYSALKWRWMGPGMHFIRTTGPSGGTMLMLRIGPGKRMPVHGHHGAELTQILRGAYDDELGHFAAGDVADLDAETEHQPVTSAGAPCICVSALDAPLRFPGWLARTLQPAFGI